MIVKNTTTMDQSDKLCHSNNKLYGVPMGFMLAISYVIVIIKLYGVP